MTPEAGAAIVVRGGRVLDARARRADPADILITGDTITAIGPPGLAAPPGAAAVDARGMLLHPGLINAHTHAHGNLAKGLGDRWTLELLLTAAPWIGGHRTLEDRHLSAKLGAVEMVLKGCTAAYDLPLELPVPTSEGLQAVGRAYAEVGMRAVVAPMVADRTLFEAIPGLLEVLTPALRAEVDALRPAPWKATLAGLRQVLDGWTLDRDRVRPAVAPTIPHHCSDELIRGCADLAREHGVGLHSHVAESKVQAIAGLQRYGKTLTAHLDDLGVLGPHFTVAHGVWLDADDMTRLADHGSSVAHNPGSNLRLGNGLADMREMLERRVNVGIGTDSANCSDNLNVYEAMRLASLVSKGRGPDVGRWVSTDEVALAATEGSARALGFEGRLGRLAPGYKADLVFLDLAHPNWIPLNDPTNQLVHTEDGGAVVHVMIGGRMVVEHRRVTTVDLAALARDAEAARERLARVTAPAKVLYERLAPVVGRFCPGLAHVPYHVDRYVASGGSGKTPPRPPLGGGGKPAARSGTPKPRGRKPA